MRNFPLVAAAIGGILASAAASSANVDLYIGGASAQSAFWKADFGTSVCGGTANLRTYTVTGVTVANEAWRCTATSTSVTNIAIGDVVTVHYNSELGSVSGISPLVYNTGVASRLFVNPDSADCANTTITTALTALCTVSTYSNTSETFTSPSSDALVVSGRTGGTFNQFDIGVSDLEIKLWSQAQNWTDTTFAAAMGSQPTTAQLTAVSGGVVMNGQVFSVIANTSGPLASLNNLSYRSLSAIMKGQYNQWGDVPEVQGTSTVANTTAIKLCRREFGSGTGVAASVFFTGRECGRSTQVMASQTAPGSLPTVVENTSTGSVRTCVQGDAGAIGFTSLSTSSNYLTINIDAVQPNAHNAAAGIYPFAYETWVYDKSASTNAGSAVVNLAGRLISNAQKITGLTSQIESTATLGANGTWTATTRRTVFALPIGGSGNTPPTVAKAASTTAAVNALVYDAGDNCKVSFNTNTL